MRSAAAVRLCAIGCDPPSTRVTPYRELQRHRLTQPVMRGGSGLLIRWGARTRNARSTGSLHLSSNFPEDIATAHRGRRAEARDSWAEAPRARPHARDVGWCEGPRALPGPLTITTGGDQSEPSTLGASSGRQSKDEPRPAASSPALTTRGRGAARPSQPRESGGGLSDSRRASAAPSERGFLHCGSRTNQVQL